MTSIYLISPRTDPMEYFGAEVFALQGLQPAQFIASLAGPTVAAMVPEGFGVQYCDDQVSPVDFDTDCRFVGITGSCSGAPRLIELADEFRRRGKTVLIGGPFASLSHDVVRPHCDILVRGEVEEIAPQLFSDLAAGTWRDEYMGTRPDLARSPIPRWDLYPNDRTLTAALQTTRGCPFECEFCDVPAYVGRKQRRKPVANVLAELDVLYRHGYRGVFFADDNFTVYRQAAKELLDALAWWSRRREQGPMMFTTAVSVDAVADDELLRLCAEAGMVEVYIGLETPSRESLAESRKRQNLRFDPIESVGRFLEHGIRVISGLIVGFDADGPDCFARVRDFVNASPIPVFTLGALTAPPQTPLYARLAADGRLAPHTRSGTGQIGGTNIIPSQMTATELLAGVRWLKDEIYSPEAFGERVIAMIRRLGPYRGPETSGIRTIPPGRRLLAQDTASVIRSLAGRGPRERAMLARLIRFVAAQRPDALSHLSTLMVYYAQIRAVDELVGDGRASA